MKNLIIIIGTILLGVIIVNTMVLGESDTSLQGERLRMWWNKVSAALILWK